MSFRKSLTVLLAVAALAGGGVALMQATTDSAHAAAAATATRLNPNSATEEQLRAIPQLNAELIAIIQKGKPFATIGAFDKAIGNKLNADQKKQLYTSLFVPINLNTASNDDIMLIPGMTKRMAHEFEEYRPYTSMEQFNREIGKYVDQAEVARLASYVTPPR